MIKRLLILLILLAVIFGGLFGWKLWTLQQMGAAQMAPPPATVAVTEVSSEPWAQQLPVTGSLVASQGMAVTSEVSGKVAEIHFTSGQRVAAGELLLNLDDSVDQAELRARIADRDFAKLRYTRLSSLVNERSASRSEFDEAKAALDVAEADVASQRALIAKKRITAPFSGVLGLRKVDLGEYLGPGSAIVGLTALDPIYLDFALPERRLSDLQIGANVSVRVAAFSDQRFPGTISAIDPEIQIGSRTLLVRATLPNPNAQLRPGMFAEAEITLGEPTATLVLPRTAITYAPYGESVFLVSEDEQGLKVERRAIQVGPARGNLVAIVDGLAEGDQVVLTGQVKLRNGQRIQVDNTLIPSDGAIGR
jgi:membrane fusion protein (multidrug efflux system)